MDDLVSSVPSLREACQLYQELVHIFNSGGFELTKSSTNSQELLETIPVILGMRWSPNSDNIAFKLDCPENKCTKRSILTAVARCYDPLGLVSQFIFYLKLLVRDLWKLKLPWNAQAPEHIRHAWEKVRQE